MSAPVVDEHILELTRYIDDQEQIKAGKKQAGEEADPNAEPTPFYVECAKLLANRKYSELFDKLLPFGPAISSNDDDIVFGFYKAITFVVKVLEPATTLKYVDILNKHFTAANDKPETRLALLTHVYNTLDTGSPARYHAFLAATSFALDTQQASRIVVPGADLVKWLQEWGASQEQQRVLLEKMCSLVESSGDVESFFSYLTELLKTYQGADAAALASVKARARTAAVVAIRSTTLYQFDALLALDAVQQLKGENVFALLSVFVSGSYNDYIEFHGKNGSALAELKLDHDELVRKIRLLTVASMACEKSELEYKAIESALAIAADDVEPWVIKTIQAGLIAAKLDQLRQVVIVQSATSRHFSTQDWAVVKSKIDTWRENIRQLLSVVHNARVEQRNKLSEVAGER